MVGLTTIQKQERHRKDLNQIAVYAEVMLQRQFPPLDLPGERWFYSAASGDIVYTANWTSAHTIKIVGDAGLWSISRSCAGHYGYHDEQVGLDLLSVRCIALEWAKEFNQRENLK